MVESDISQNDGKQWKDGVTETEAALLKLLQNIPNAIKLNPVMNPKLNGNSVLF